MHRSGQVLFFFPWKVSTGVGIFICKEISHSTGVYECVCVGGGGSGCHVKVGVYSLNQQAFRHMQ